ncbi:MAG TPA: hypothetical protein VGH28_27630 [Polyangiaceae bacterium]|jgi:hypothetical protein
MKPSEHRELADALRARVTEAKGKTDSTLRTAAMNRAALAEPFGALVAQIDEAAARVTDDQVAAVREALGSDKAAFEIVMAAAIGAGLRRFDRAMRAIEESGDATE